jgi:hypothetical protein
MNSMISLALRRASYDRKTISISQTRKANDDTRMIMAVVILFIILETPTFLIYFEQWSDLPVAVVRIISLTNNAVNFLVYAMFGKYFREKLMKTCRWCSRSRNKRRAEMR